MPGPGALNVQTATDIVSHEKRSCMMRAVRQRGTSAELAVRSILSESGVYYRLNRRTLPGSPDISNCSKGWALFVNGCFWHGHKNCDKTKSGRSPRVPLRNHVYWSTKLKGNRFRDARKVRELRGVGLRVAIVWECELRDKEALRERLEQFARLRVSESRAAHAQA